MATRIEGSVHALMAWLGLAVDDILPTAPVSAPTTASPPARPARPVTSVPPSSAVPKGTPVPTSRSGMHLVPPLTECTRPLRRPGHSTAPLPRPPGPPRAA